MSYGDVEISLKICQLDLISQSHIYRKCHIFDSEAGWVGEDQCDQIGRFLKRSWQQICLQK